MSSREFTIPPSRSNGQQQPVQQKQKRNMNPMEREPLIKSPAVDYKSMVSFMEVSNSFLSPWTWDPKNNLKIGLKETGSAEPTYMKWEPGSYFAYEVLDMKPPEGPKPSQKP